MVYATRTNRTMIATKPIKKTRKSNGRLEQIGDFLENHTVTFACKEGEMVAIVDRRNNGEYHSLEAHP